MSLLAPAKRAPGRAPGAGSGPAPSPRGVRPLRIGLVNNMPDAALGATEAQFRSLLEAAAGPRAVTLELFALEGVRRGAAARARLGRDYGRLETLLHADLDGLVVTGAEPLGGRVAHEPIYPEICALADLARGRALPTVWSCLAAHAAAFHLTGVERRPLGRKLSGVFAFERAEPHRLTQGCETPVAPHSRLNGVPEDALRASGFQILTRAAEHGVDAFALDADALFVFLQGHPEYDAAALLFEWRRDIRRAVAANAPPPPPPEGYFLPETAALIRAAGDDPTALLAAAGAARPAGFVWRAWAECFWRNWLALVDETAQARGVGASMSAAKA